MSTDIQAKDVKRLLVRVYQRYQSGAITEAQASKETAILNSILKAIEVTDLENRVSQIEETINITLDLK
jgi:hypothetical protein